MQNYFIQRLYLKFYLTIAVHPYALHFQWLVIKKNLYLIISVNMKADIVFSFALLFEYLVHFIPFEKYTTFILRASHSPKQIYFIWYCAFNVFRFQNIGL